VAGGTAAAAASAGAAAAVAAGGGADPASLTMAQRRNYGFERRQKDLARRSRQEEKRARKTEREQQGESGPEMAAAAENGAPAGRWEWFSPSRGRVVTTEPRKRPEEAPDDWVLLTENDDAQSSGSD
jgi:hypothetical protein